MARLEFIKYSPWREGVDEDGLLTMVPDSMARHFSRLPQIYWSNGEAWSEVNHFLLDKASTVGIKLATPISLAKHLKAYADFLEREKLDWRHFPIRRDDRAIIRFRGAVVEQRDSGAIGASTASKRMPALIQFYRHADGHDFLFPETPMWSERSVVLPYYDRVGFKRAIVRISTDLAIPNRKRSGSNLEDGLWPLSEKHMTELMEFCSRTQPKELRFMLTVGFFSGARLSTITTLRIENLEQALPDSHMPGFFLIRVGPGTGVATKGDVSGNLLVPDFLLAALKKYAYSVERLKREAKAPPENRSILFLTSRGAPYAGGTVSRLMANLRQDAVRAGLKFMQKFHFHQSRATYGTWLMKLALTVTTVPAAIEFVMSAMLHKDEATTMKYVKFIHNSKGKEEAAKAFSEAFTGLRERNWDQFNA